MHYEYFLTTLILASHALFHLPVEGKCTPKGRCQRSESHNDHALQGHMYREVKVNRYPACYAECENDKRCMSLNFSLLTLICQLNHHTATTKPSWLVWRKNSIYAEQIDRYPAGSCENPGKSCKTIRQALGRTSSGEYFIDPTRSGNPFIVFCDMKTDGGGWTLIKRYKLKSMSLDLTKAIAAKDYRDLSNYHLNSQVVYSPVLHQLRRDMGFDQMRWYCFKKSVGRVFHIMTKLNHEGEAVVNYFTANPTPARPLCANSFTRLLDDTSKVSQQCSLRWTKWGTNTDKGKGRVYYRFIVTTAKYALRFIPYNSHM